MFASSYFAPRYFAPRYFPKVGAESILAAYPLTIFFTRAAQLMGISVSRADNLSMGISRADNLSITVTRDE